MSRVSEFLLVREVSSVTQVSWSRMHVNVEGFEDWT